MKKRELERKLKRERVEVCLTCKHFAECNHTSEFEECSCFVEVEEQFGCRS